MSSSKGRLRSNETKLKLRFPCELSVRYLLPVVRAHLAHELAKTYGVNQARIADVLDVTQPAVSMYLKSEISIKRPELERCLEELKAIAEKLASDIYLGKISQTEAMLRVCSFCIWLRAGGPICRMHEEIVPALRTESCSLCLKDLATEKRRTLEEYEILENVRRAVGLVEESQEFSTLIPEIGANIAMAKPDAKTINDVVGVQGRIHVVAGKPRATGPPEFGGSSHVASAVLTAMKYDGSIRSAINIKFDWPIIEICRELGLKISFFNRSEEPIEIKSVDGRTIPWGIDLAIKKAGFVPDAVYDLGDIGKEPMLFLFKTTAYDVAYLAIRISKEYQRRKGM